MKRYEYKVLPWQSGAFVNQAETERQAVKLENTLNQYAAYGWVFCMWKNQMILLQRELEK